ncbi:MAG: hypothetical protein IKH26_05930 [Bacteroidaceae bacterium]|nr:hypothetical protein [Bacteroidaceae bacterium]
MPNKTAKLRKIAGRTKDFREEKQQLKFPKMSLAKDKVPKSSKSPPSEYKRERTHYMMQLIEELNINYAGQG